MTDTIVKKFSNQIKTITEVLHPLNIKVVALNHAPVKYNRYGESGETKGVDSDHIKIFNLTSLKSFAFAFYYSKTPTPYVMTSVKVGEKIIVAKYNEISFKQKLNQFVSLLNILRDSSNLTAATVESTFSATFIKNQEYDIEQEVKEVIEQIRPKLDELHKKNELKLNQKITLESNINKIQSSIKSEVNAAMKKENVKELQEKLNVALDRVAELESKLKSNMGLKTEEDKLRKVSRDLYSYEQKVEEIISAESAKLPKYVRELVRGQIKIKN